MSQGLLQSIDQQTRLAGHNRLALLLFRLAGRQLYGINVFKVQEVMQRPTVTWMPHAHPMVVGVAHIRDQTIPILDLAKAIGGEPAPAQGGYVIVTEFNRSVQGFLVNLVERIINVGVDTVQPPPSGGGKGGYLTAITRYGEALVQIIDVEQVLSDVTGGPRDISTELLKRARKGGVPLRVLVVDDSRVARAQIERVLTQLGIESVLARDGREALNYLQGIAERAPAHEQLAMVISDIEMPDMDGYTLTTEIRRDARLRDLYVLLHTSLSGVFNNAMVEKVGANRFIAKYNPDELATGIMDRLGQIAAEVS
ncbi:MAG: chemotaxis protein CheV [Gammaproteobacteria bacterium]|nr:chemotaxis protein CheV [Gammaproteobacteria bacterium]